ncbi:hemolysin family protein [Luteolibacter marinus]|uniref:hemolysin family protein n=1 Tax=Luteolibacter marinus TaxID=2776705 RepID=UPI0018668182|nr:hemolysin family protein [Luteolibacter marinus]
MALLIVYVLVALGFSFLCSLLEATLLTITPTAVQAAKQRGTRWAETMEKLKADIDSPLSAILTLNTIAHTMGAAGAGAQYQRTFGNGTEAIFAAMLTLAILVFTEIIPKTLGARYAMFFAPFTAWFLPKLQFILAPLVWLCGQVTRLITFGKADLQPMHREELLAVARLGEEVGELKSSEGAIVRNILQLGDMRVSDIMTPRPVVFMLPMTTTLREFAANIGDKPFSRIPVFGTNRDDVHGFVLRSDALLACLKNDADTLESVMRPLEAVPQLVGVDHLFQRFLSDGHQILLVHDEFGTSVGLVTLEDVLETIVGVEIVDEKDNVPDLQVLARKLWSERAAKMGIAIPDDGPSKSDG